MKRTALPVTVIGGYLGAGKTSLVNHLLRERGGLRIAVLVNDFGELSIDHDLIESTEGKVMRLSGGCVCCSFGSDLVTALTEMPSLRPQPDHILIETSGVALPGSVARTLRLLPVLALDAVIVVADAQTLRLRAADPYVGDTVLQQLVDADLIVLNKADLVDATTLDGLAVWLDTVAPAARRLSAHHARLPPQVVMGTGIALLRQTTLDDAAPGAGMLRAPRPLQAAQLFESASFEFHQALDCHALAAALCAPALGLVRAKGLLRNLDGGSCAVQLVGSRASVAPSGHPRPEVGRLVCIGVRGRFDRDGVEALVSQARGSGSVVSVEGRPEP